MTKGITAETVDGMSLAKIDRIINELRYERFRWTPVRRVNIPKPNGKTRALGIPTGPDKLLQEVIRMILEAYYEPQFSDRSHGFGPAVELVLGNGRHANGNGNGHAAIPANGNGNGHAPVPACGNGNSHHDEAPETQQSLFSWAEFKAGEDNAHVFRGRRMVTDTPRPSPSLVTASIPIPSSMIEIANVASRSNTDLSTILPQASVQ